MCDETLQRIFEPSYTTRDMARRSGLGLAVVHGIVDEHAGFVTCESDIGTGTTFDVYLPAMESEELWQPI
jgi:signal transduction histidine kinase